MIDDAAIQSLLFSLKSKGIEVFCENSTIKIRYNKAVSLTSHEKSLLTKCKKELIQYFNHKNHYSVQALQKGIYYHHVKQLDSNNYHVQIVLTIEADLNIAQLENALLATLQQHVALRVNYFQDQNGDISQVIRNKIDFCLCEEDLCQLNNVEQRQKVNEYLKHDKLMRFNLETDLLHRFKIFKLFAGRYQLVWSYHHILIDGWSMSLVIHTLIKIYNKSPIISTKTHMLPHIQEHTQSNEFWQRYLEGFTEENRFIFEDGNSVRLISDKKHYLTNLGNKSTKIISFAKKNQITLSSLFQVAWAGTLANYCDAEDIVFGVLCSTRTPLMNDEVGFLMNTLPVRIKLYEEKTVLTILQQCQSNTLTLTQECRKNINDICETVNYKGRQLFNTLLLVDNFYKLHELSIGNGKIIQVDVYEENNYPLTLVLTYDAKQISLRIDYDDSTFTQSFIEACANRFIHNLIWVTENLEQPAHQILSANYTIKLPLASFGYCNTSYNQSLRHQFLTIKDQYPDQLAVSDGISTLTYGSLFTKAFQLASHLSCQNEDDKSPIAIYCYKSIELSVAIVACMLIQKPYLLINPVLSPLLINEMIKHSKCQHVLTLSSLESKIEANNKIVINEINNACEDFILPQQCRHGYLYQNYTSGTTGIAKTVFVSIDNFTNLMASMQDILQCSLNDSLLSLTSISFDIFNLEFWLPLLTGGQLHLYEMTSKISESTLKNSINNIKPSVIQATPTVWSQLIDLSDFEWQTQFIVGGEPLTFTLKEKLLKKASVVFNAYGPTETTVWSSTAKLEPHTRVTIGKPLFNTIIFILNREGNPVLPFEAGEIYIGGKGLVDGYVNNDEANAKSFVSKIVANHKYSLFKTGDFGYWDEYNNLNFICRKDDMVKIRGHRVELHAIEHCLSSYKSVARSWCITQGKGVEKKIISFIQRNQESKSQKRKIDLSLFFFSSKTEGDYDLYLNAARYADQHAFKAIWTPERHFDPVGGHYPNPALLSAALAMITQSIELRAGSCVLPLHHPTQVVEDWAIIDKLSNGRIGISLAPGWHARDFVLNPTNYSTRKQELVKNISIISRLWEGQSHEFKDGNNIPTTVKTYPRPNRPALPLWMTVAGNKQSYIQAGELGLNILTHLLIQSKKELQENILAYKDALQKNGFSIQDKQITLMLHTYVANENEDFYKIVEPALKRYLRAHLTLGKDQSTFSGEDTRSIDQDKIIERAFTRLISKNSLIGKVDHCKKVVSKFHAIGVTEIACFIDFGIEDKLVLSRLENIKQLEDVHNYVDENTFLKKIKQYLSLHLPYYMQPNKLYIIEEPPLTINGKLDINFLRGLIEQSNELMSEMTNEISGLLKSIFQEILSIHHIPYDADFFELGGNSIKALTLIYMIKTAFSVNLTINDIFTNTTIEKLQRCIEQKCDIPTSSIPHISENDIVPLSFAQERLHLFAEINPLQKSLLTIPTLFEFSNKVDKSALFDSIRIILTRHAILRATLQYCEGKLYQTALPLSAIPIHEITLGNSPLTTVINEIIDDVEFSPGYPLIHITYINSVTPQANALVIVQSHLISENAGRSGQIFVKELSEIYYKIVRNQTVNLPELAISYFDYAIWTRQQPLILDEMMKAWLNRYVNVKPSRLPTDRLVKSAHGERFILWLDEEFTTSLSQICRKTQVTEYMFLFAIYSYFVSKLSQESNTLIGSPFINRRHPDLHNLIGFFVNTLPLLMDFSNELTVAELLKQAREVCLQAYRYQHLPFETLISQLSAYSELRPSFNLLFAYQNDNELTEFTLDGLPVSVSSPYLNTTEFDLSVIMYLRKGRFKCVFEYNSGLFDEMTIKRYASYYQRLLEGSILSLEMPLRRLQFMNPQEIKNCFSFSEIKRNTKISNLTTLLKNAITNSPQKIALQHNNKEWSYLDIDLYSDYLAELLLSKYGKQSYIPLYTTASASTIIAIFAILKTGAAYVPLNLDQSHETLHSIMQELGDPVLLVDEITKKRAEKIFVNIEILNIKDILTNAQVKKVSDLPTLEDKTNLAYLIYTSGTTGKPKGVPITHGQVLSLLNACKEKFDFSKDDVWSLFHELSFDFSVWELFAAFFNQATLVIIDQTSRRNSQEFYEQLNKLKITVLSQTPSSFYRLMLEDNQSYQRLTSLKYVILGGECFIPKHYKSWFMKYGFNSPQVINMYGITEVTVHATYKLITMEDMNNDLSPIGKFLSGISGVVLDQNQELLPPNVVGELYIYGDRITEQYFNSPDETNKSFIKFKKYPKIIKFYKSGDKVLYDIDNNLYYLGRYDEQIKLRGYRIELNLIENVLLMHDQVNSVKVMLLEDSLIVFICLKASLRNAEKTIKAYLKARLTEYEIPDKFVFIDKMPLNSNCKIDSKKLLEQYQISSNRNCSNPCPKTLLDKLLYIIRAELHDQKIQPNTNLFDLGLNSLNASIITYRLKEEFGIYLPIVTMFINPEINQFLDKVRMVNETESLSVQVF